MHMAKRSEPVEAPPPGMVNNGTGHVTGRISHRLNTGLERVLPEQRLFLRSDTETRFVRLRPMTQALILTGSTLVVAWTIFATAILLVGALSAGDAHQQAMREQANYEARLNALSHQRDARAEEAASAQARFNTALSQVSAMQSELLASEDHRHELETGIEVIQKTLRRTIKERDEARAETLQLRAQLAHATGADHTVAGRARDVAATLDFLSAELTDTAAARDAAATKAAVADAAASRAELDTKLIEQRNSLIFSKLEQAVSTSMAPLDKMFHSVGLDPKKVIAEIRSGYASGEGGPLTPIAYPATSQQGALDVKRANRILDSLRKMNDYRLAEERIPLGLPLKTRFRYSSPFGWRKNPFNGKPDFHPGQDLAGAYGSPIYATGGGIVIHAGWNGGYGREVMIQHAFGIKSLYGHMSQIRVHVGQRVSRGQRIGDMGSSGRSTGPHVHYEIRVGNKPVNPRPYIKAATHVF
jgi:murein DD-endopeptidase MepM/ murein hydrolase activator NlpD